MMLRFLKALTIFASAPNGSVADPMAKTRSNYTFSRQMLRP